MADSWDVATPSERTFDVITNFVIFCEDEVGEKVYLEGLQKPKKVKVSCIPNQKAGYNNYVNALTHCYENGMAENHNGSLRIKPMEVTQIWCVYDRDAEDPLPANLKLVNQTRFSSSINNAVHAGLKVAWSNDVFELWILLHFENVDPLVWRHRTYIYDRLTDIFKNLPEQPPELAKVTSHPHFYYKTWMKNESNFRNFVRPLLEPRRVDAIQRAQALDNHFTGTGCFFHDRNPCTKVYELVQAIISYY